MSFSVEKTKKQLPFRYLFLPLSAAIVWFVPYRELVTNILPLTLAPLWVLSGHFLCGFSYLITAHSAKKGLGLLRSSWTVYGKSRSPVHLQAAFLTALMEETVFRYALLSLAITASGSIIGSIVGTSLLFSLAHMQRGLRLGRIFVYLDYFLFALILGTLVVACQSIFPAIIIHTMRNYILRCLLISKEEYNKLKAAQEKAAESNNQ